MYSSLYLLANQIYEEEDEAKSCITGAATGMFQWYISELLWEAYIISIVHETCPFQNNHNSWFLGLLYKSSSGLKGCAKGGLFGLTAAALWAFLLKKDQRISDYI